MPTACYKHFNTIRNAVSVMTGFGYRLGMHVNVDGDGYMCPIAMTLSMNIYCTFSREFIDGFIASWDFGQAYPFHINHQYEMGVAVARSLKKWCLSNSIRIEDRRAFKENPYDDEYHDHDIS